MPPRTPKNRCLPTSVIFGGLMGPKCLKKKWVAQSLKEKFEEKLDDK